MRLRTVSCQAPGWRRVRRGRGFSYLNEAGKSLPAEAADRIKSLAIPPAWTDVWICPDDRGHLQAVGTDEAGRRQYLYHPEWRKKRDAAKFDRAVELGRRLPRLRSAVRRDLAGDPAAPTAVLAAAIRLVDLGCFRLGSTESADDNGSFGLTTLEIRHVTAAAGKRIFTFTGKSGVPHEIAIADPDLLATVDALRRRRRPGSRLLAFRDAGNWRPVGPAAINERIRELVRMDVSAKDFRTWKATATVAEELAGLDRAASQSGRRRQVRAAIATAADLLGNTPAVARGSYVDPRIIDLFEDGVTIGAPSTEDTLDRAVVRLIEEST